MKGLNDDNSNGNSNNMNNWLGFSLSPHMKMEAQNHHHHHHHLPPTYSPHHVIYGLAENNDFHSPLSVMPLKSDGSLCIMEALSRSHPQGHVVAASSPKLEDFLGGATMAAHQYAMHPRDHAMVLSLDNAFYNQEPFRQHYYPSFFNGVYQPANEEQTTKLLTQTPDEEIPCFKTWMDHHHAVLEQQQQQQQQMINSTTAMVDHVPMGCNDLQSLTLSMSPGSQSSCVTASRQISPTENTDSVTAIGAKKRGAEKLGQKPTVHRKSIDTFGQRTSQYRGVTRHRWTGRYEAHLWDNSCKKEGQTRKGRQVYLGGYDMEEKAARAYDLAALKYWGPSTHINFAVENYHQELEDMKNMSRQEYVAHLRRKSSGFSRGASIYRGVTRHHQHGRWQARIGRVAGNKDLYLGTFSTQEEAAEAYDIAAIKFRGVNAVTNFDISRYDVEKIMASNTLPTGEIARRTKPNPEVVVECNPTAQMESVANGSCDWKMVLNNDGDQRVDHVKTMNHGSYPSPAYSIALHDLIGLESSHNVVDEPASTMAPHFSNASSLVTSLNSSREGSPDKYGVPAILAKPNSANVGSWIPTGQLRPGQIATGHHLPVFTAWNDA